MSEQMINTVTLKAWADALSDRHEDEQRGLVLGGEIHAYFLGQRSVILEIYRYVEGLEKSDSA